MEEDLYRLLGGVGALAFVLEGVVVPVSIAAHILLFLVFQRLAPRRDALLWLVTAGAASLLTSALLGVTPIRLLLALYPFSREDALVVTAFWLISAWFYWNIATAVFRRSGVVSAALYALGAGLFPIRLGFLLISAGILLMGALFFKTGFEMLQQRGGAGQPGGVAPGGSVNHYQKHHVVVYDVAVA
jgi:hypothetical protein